MGKVPTLFNPIKPYNGRAISNGNHLNLLVSWDIQLLSYSLVHNSVEFPLTYSKLTIFKIIFVHVKMCTFIIRSMKERPKNSSPPHLLLCNYQFRIIKWCTWWFIDVNSKQNLLNVIKNINFFSYKHTFKLKINRFKTVSNI